MVKIFEDLFTGTGLTVGILFLFLAVYFIQDVVRKLNKAESLEAKIDSEIESAEKETSSKVDNLEKKMVDKFNGIEKSLSTISEKQHTMNNLIQQEVLRREMQSKSIDTLSMDSRDFAHRLTSLESALQAKPLVRQSNDH